MHGANLFPSLVQLLQQNISLFVILSADLWDKQVFCRKGVHLSALSGFLCSIDGSSTESQRSRNIMKLAHQDRTQQRWDQVHCYFFFFSLLFYDGLGPSFLSNPVHICLSATVHSLLLCSMSSQGAFGDSLCYSTKSSHPAQQFPADAAFFLK